MRAVTGRFGIGSGTRAARRVWVTVFLLVSVDCVTGSWSLTQAK
jgi:hypothetical protein